MKFYAYQFHRLSTDSKVSEVMIGERERISDFRPGDDWYTSHIIQPDGTEVHLNSCGEEISK